MVGWKRGNKNWLQTVVLQALSALVERKNPLYIFSEMLTTVIVLTLLGIVMIALEVLLPGGVLGIAGALAIGVALILTATSPELNYIGSGGRFLLAGGVLAGTVVSLLLWLRFFASTGFVKKHLLQGGIGGTSTYEKYQQLLDTTGTAETDLRPVGKAKLDGIRYDVTAETGSIERGSDVKVVKVEGSTVTVRVTS
ncbi:MAG: membrane-bound serine protease (ClpP class) [Verrucomicrobiales bacterium]